MSSSHDPAQPDPTAPTTRLTLEIDAGLLARARRKAEVRGEVVEEWLVKKLGQYAEFANDVPQEQRRRHRPSTPPDASAT